MITRSTPDDPTPGSHTIHTHLNREGQPPTVQEALALLLAPDTEYHTRVQVTRRLARCGPSILPLVLSKLSNAQEILKPAWPWWPPQYEHCSRLLANLSQKTHLRLD